MTRDDSCVKSDVCELRICPGKDCVLRLARVARTSADGNKEGTDPLRRIETMAARTKIIGLGEHLKTIAVRNDSLDDVFNLIWRVCCEIYHDLEHHRRPQ